MASPSVNSSVPVAIPRLLSVVTLPTHVEPITQLEIAALLSLQNRARQLAEQVAAAEKSLKTRLESHAAVEVGEHTAELSTSSRRTVAWREVAERLGDRLYGDGKGAGYCDRVLQSTHPSHTVNLVAR
jgi:hypothetical protein